MGGWVGQVKERMGACPLAEQLGKLGWVLGGVRAVDAQIARFMICMQEGQGCYALRCYNLWEKKQLTSKKQSLSLVLSCDSAMIASACRSCSGARLRLSCVQPPTAALRKLSVWSVARSRARAFTKMGHCLCPR